MENFQADSVLDWVFSYWHGFQFRTVLAHLCECALHSSTTVGDIFTTTSGHLKDFPEEHFVVDGTIQINNVFTYIPNVIGTCTNFSSHLVFRSE